MNIKYIVVIESESSLPDRRFLVGQAWGDLPISYFQDGEVFGEGAFLDLKVNKWEINSKWSAKQDNEPWIRIEVLQGRTAEEFINNTMCPLPEVLNKKLIVMELDEGGGAIDEMLLQRLVAVFCEAFRVFRWGGCLEELNERSIASLPTLHFVREQLFKGGDT